MSQFAKRRMRCALVAASVCGFCCTAHADIATPLSSTAANVIPATTSVAAPQVAPPPDRSLGEGVPWLLRTAFHPLNPASSAAVTLDDPIARTEQELPPAPSSLKLALGALASLGAYWLGRHTRPHVAALPDWYHSGGPVQVRHATPLSLDFRLSALPISPFAVPTASAPARPPLRWLWLQPSIRVHLQESLLLLVNPRGPPYDT